jgi:hypothetical protein
MELFPLGRLHKTDLTGLQQIATVEIHSCKIMMNWQNKISYIVTMVYFYDPSASLYGHKLLPMFVRPSIGSSHVWIWI